MNFESINEDVLNQMENSTTQITQQEINYLNNFEKLNKIENKLDNIYKELCKLGSEIGNIYTILNDINKNILC